MFSTLPGVVASWCPVTITTIRFDDIIIEDTSHTSRLHTHSFISSSLAENTVISYSGEPVKCSRRKDIFYFQSSEGFSSSLWVGESISCCACCECAAASVYNSCFHSEGGRQLSNHHIKPCCEPAAAHLPTRVTGLLFKQLPGLWS